MTNAYAMHQRLCNWAEWSQWRGPRGHTLPGYTRRSRTSVALLVALKDARPHQYRAVRYYYLTRRYGDMTGIDQLAGYLARAVPGWRYRADGLSDEERADRWLDAATAWLCNEATKCSRSLPKVTTKAYISSE